eukprot:scaffold8247_cov116-Isochrysis_galbana.AAC.3
MAVWDPSINPTLLPLRLADFTRNRPAQSDVQAAFVRGGANGAAKDTSAGYLLHNPRLPARVGHERYYELVRHGAPRPSGMPQLESCCVPHATRQKICSIVVVPSKLSSPVHPFRSLAGSQVRR